MLLLGLLMVLALPVRAAPGLQLDDRAARLDLWQVATVLEDPAAAWTLQEVLARSASFQPAGPLKGNLGRRAGAVWLQVPLQVPVGGAGRWMLDVDYPSLDRVDVFVMDGERIEHQVQMGDHVDRASKAWPARSHVMPLDLPAGAQRTLLIRVQTVGTMLVPAMLYTPAAYQQQEAAEQALQGLMAGMGLCLLVYTLVQWWMLRDVMFGLYAVTLLGTTAFFAALSGVGPQHVWGASTWLVQNGPPFFILVGVCGAFFFVLRALQVRSTAPRVATVIAVAGAVAGLTAAGFALGLVGYSTAQGIGMALGPLPLLLVLPTAFRRLRDGDRAAAYVLAGWGVYSVGVIVIVGLLAGRFPLGFWTMHAFQFASLLEMAMWMLVLAQRVQDIRRRAALVQGERDRMHSLAHTDALTGLLNRRGLDALLPERVALATAEQPLAVFLLDLDGFKTVNDTLGHDAGDLLLQEVAQRLRGQLRASDLLCRLGGDEFVVAASHLKSLDDAQVLDQKLLRAFDAPAEVGGSTCRVGATVGYALAPHDDRSAAGLFKRADSALYAGKQADKNCVKRGAVSAGASRL
jgi:diguanylate cyclase (GGDEF)-like protein